MKLNLKTIQDKYVTVSLSDPDVEGDVALNVNGKTILWVMANGTILRNNELGRDCVFPTDENGKVIVS
jgi:hypothetical protein